MSRKTLLVNLTKLKVLYLDGVNISSNGSECQSSVRFIVDRSISEVGQKSHHRSYVYSGSENKLVYGPVPGPIPINVCDCRASIVKTSDRGRLDCCH